MRNRLTLFTLFLIVFMTSGCATAPLASKTAEERYKAVSDDVSKLAVGGRINRIDWAEDGSAVSYTCEGQRYRFDFNHQTLEKIAETQHAQPRRDGNRPGRGRAPARGRQRDRATSPDGQWVAICKDWNVFIEPARKNADDSDDADSSNATQPAASQPEPIAVTTDGNRKFRFGVASWVYGEELDQRDAMWWSPDSRKLAFYEFDERKVPDHYITGDLTKLHTKLLTEGYPKPGEPNPIANLLIYDLDSRSLVRVEGPKESGEWYTYGVQFTPDKNHSELLFHRTNRHQNVLHLVAADLATGKTRVVLTETQDTWQDNSPDMQFLEDGHRFIWATEKTGWKQYELRDLDGRLINTLTHGDYQNSSIIRVDEKAGVMFYTAFSDGNPLSAQLHRVNLDGTGQVRLTGGPFNHSITLSPDGQWFISETEAIGSAPITELYDAAGKRVAVLARSDTSHMKELKLSMPEMFTFKADDGKTDIYGVLYKPSHFDPHRKYPLVIDVYGGPMFQSVHNRFTPGRPECEYGFLVAAIDNRGTRNRGKAFEAATYLKLGVVDIKDQADAVRYLEQRPYVDAKHVGIMGFSYGGYMSALALLKYPDVYAAACAGGTVTDWRNYDSIYTERFMRTPQENPEGYDAGSCLKYVNNLKGKLLLLHGMLDDNVHTNNVWQLIDKLQKANKPFEMMFYPNAGHGFGPGEGQLRWDFMRRVLLGSN